MIPFDQVVKQVGEEIPITIILRCHSFPTKTKVCEKNIKTMRTFLTKDEVYHCIIMISLFFAKPIDSCSKLRGHPHPLSLLPSASQEIQRPRYWSRSFGNSKSWWLVSERCSVYLRDVFSWLVSASRLGRYHFLKFLSFEKRVLWLKEVAGFQNKKCLWEGIILQQEGRPYIHQPVGKFILTRF